MQSGCHCTLQNVDVLLGATRILIEDIHTFNKDCAAGLKSKKESDENVNTSIENSLKKFMIVY